MSPVLPPASRAEWDGERLHLAFRELWITVLEVLEDGLRRASGLRRWFA